MKKILVNGGAEFLDSHLCEKLVYEGRNILCVDNYYTGTKSNIAPLMPQTNFEVMRHDITFPLYIEVDQRVCWPG